MNLFAKIKNKIYEFIHSHLEFILQNYENDLIIV